MTRHLDQSSRGPGLIQRRRTQRVSESALLRPAAGADVVHIQDAVVHVSLVRSTSDGDEDTFPVGAQIGYETARCETAGSVLHSTVDLRIASRHT